MSDLPNTAPDLFRSWVLEAYRTLLDAGGFAELLRPTDLRENAFVVRLANVTTVIEVEGIHYGAGAWTKVFRLADVDADAYGLPIGELLANRDAERVEKRGRAQGQRAEIFQDAADIIRQAQDISSGDFTALDAIVEHRQQVERERAARAPSPRQREANKASSSAGHAFKRGDYAEVVKLLGPHLDLLSPSDRKRYEIARRRERDA